MNVENVYVLLQKHQEKQLPFVIYRKPLSGTLQVFLQQDSGLYMVTEYTDSGFVFAPFDHQKPSIIIPKEKSVYYTTQVPTTAVTGKATMKEVSDIQYESRKRTHIQLVKEGIKAIDSGICDKVVLSRKEEIPMDSPDAFSLFQKLVTTYQEAFVYCWYHPQVGMWLGATPETLLHSQGNKFLTMALAGTQLYKETTDVTWGEKEVVEQKMVTDYIVKQLSNISNNVKSSDSYTHKAGSLLHIRTDIHAEIDTQKTGLYDVIKTLHPTPAVCGLPKAAAHLFIDSYEKYDREFYTGFLGELNLDATNDVTSHLFVNLRCMQLQEDKALLYIGGGITKDSNPDLEWDETVRKTETMKRVLF